MILEGSQDNSLRQEPAHAYQYPRQDIIFSSEHGTRQIRNQTL